MTKTRISKVKVTRRGQIEKSFTEQNVYILRLFHIVCLVFIYFGMRVPFVAYMSYGMSVCPNTRPQVKVKPSFTHHLLNNNGVARTLKKDTHIEGGVNGLSSDSVLFKIGTAS